MSILSGRSPATLQRWAVWLIVFTIAWNVIEGVIAVGSGVAADSIALVGFGLDSFIEVFAAGVILWRFTESEASATAERRATTLIGLTFFVLAAYIAFEAGHSLLMRETPETSAIGLVLAVMSLVIMPGLAYAKRSVARQLGSRSLEAEAVETFVCSYLSLTLLLGLGLNALFGWWWADPIAALAMLPLVLREGWEAMTERDLCCDE